MNNIDIKIADFGFAKKLRSGQKENLPCGTPSYMAPEIVNGRDYECEVDIWSTGVITHLLLTGDSPFRGKDNYQTKHNIVTKVITCNGPEWDHISDSAKDFVRQALERD